MSNPPEPNQPVQEAQLLAKAEELQRIPELSDLPLEQRLWLAERCEFRDLAAGEIVFVENEPAEHMSLLLQGRFQYLRAILGNDMPAFVTDEPLMGGALPFSRLSTYTVTLKAATAARAALFPRSKFGELLHNLPQLTERIVHSLLDRVRETSRGESNYDRLQALGKLSAGLAHELNNPASAALRSAETLQEALRSMDQSGEQLALAGVTPEELHAFKDVEACMKNATAAQAASPLERMKLEDDLTAALEAMGIPNAWEESANLASAGFSPAMLQQVSGTFSKQKLPHMLRWLSCSASVAQLAEEIRDSVCRISEVVKSVKEYSHMDQAPVQDMDLHRGLEVTLNILRHKWNKVAEIEKQFAADLPLVRANGGELNQVWTNLLDNAIDAIASTKKLGVISISTRMELNQAVIDIKDNGPGIPPEIIARIFDPFFTTKPVGEGTGLGLDLVQRLVRRNRGSVGVESRPGETVFQVRLPIKD